jgi:hypothetical protein
MWREEVIGLAAGILLLGFAVVVAGCLLLARLCLRAVRRRRERLRWDDLVARHQDLDRELENIWQHW